VIDPIFFGCSLSLLFLTYYISIRYEGKDLFFIIYPGKNKIEFIFLGRSKPFENLSDILANLSHEGVNIVYKFNAFFLE